MLRNFVKLSILASCLTLALVTGCQNHRSGNQTAKPARASSTPRKQASASTKAAKQTPAPTPAPEATPSPGVGLPAKQAVPVTPPPKKTPPILYSAKHDESIREIFSLANKGRWEEAEMRAMQMHELDPEDPTVDRLRNWVAQERQLLRDRAVEDQIREINAKNSVFNPTLRSLATESKDRDSAQGRISGMQSNKSKQRRMCRPPMGGLTAGRASCSTFNPVRDA